MLRYAAEAIAATDRDHGARVAFDVVEVVPAATCHANPNAALRDAVAATETVPEEMTNAASIDAASLVVA